MFVYSSSIVLRVRSVRQHHDSKQTCFVPINWSNLPCRMVAKIPCQRQNHSGIPVKSCCFLNSHQSTCPCSSFWQFIHTGPCVFHTQTGWKSLHHCMVIVDYQWWLFKCLWINNPNCSQSEQSRGRPTFQQMPSAIGMQVALVTDTLTSRCSSLAPLLGVWECGTLH